MWYLSNTETTFCRWSSIFRVSIVVSPLMSAKNSYHFDFCQKLATICLCRLPGSVLCNSLYFASLRLAIHRFYRSESRIYFLNADFAGFTLSLFEKILAFGAKVHVRYFFVGPLCVCDCANRLSFMTYFCTDHQCEIPTVCALLAGTRRLGGRARNRIWIAVTPLLELSGDIWWTHLQVKWFVAFGIFVMCAIRIRTL